ncbi:dihydrolipoyl dehydrogenase family protein [Cellulomonas marina]|uniref:Dihydrolipoamide dehydrogenase n=1 Tax=Cellulomonas marina TaxID=988821 RepID=A0A1I0V9A3_9CELL|nr:NAD(P)/FAD-dependent oxidoreductase [Cellulomonas marina]GIG28379.1 oxidoreductase [Cellulomonas marina]SFA72156.1 dihydrolipoamide dehydrogenase [Cellulomonas marina]
MAQRAEQAQSGQGAEGGAGGGVGDAGGDVREVDVVVIGAGAIGENAADRASRTGLSVAVVEAELVGGECSYWACMPSKALLRPGAAVAAAKAVPGADAAVTGGIDAAAVLAYRDEIASHYDDASQVEWVEGAGLTLLRGHARFTGERELTITHDGTTHGLRARHAVIVCTGSVPTLPPVDGLADVDPWTSRDATSAKEVPGRLAIIGGGVVGVEMATAYAELGSQVTLLVRGDRVLAPAEPFASELLADALRDLGVELLLGAETRAARRAGGAVELDVTGPDGERTLTVDRVLVAAGRRPGTADLGLETIGLEPGRALEVDDALQVTGVAGGWLFACGDVTDRTHTTHQGKYDARVVGDVVAARFASGSGGAATDSNTGSDASSGDEEPPLAPAPSAEAEQGAGPWSRYRATADAHAVPQVVFTHPEVAWVGPTQAEAEAAGLPVRAISYDLSAVAGASVHAKGYVGRAQVLVDTERRVLVGATFVGPDAGEMLHAATIAVVGEVPIDRLWHAVPSYPTVSEVWLRFLESAGL